MIQLDLRSALFANLADLEPGDQIAVGLSGGGDSVALLKAAVHVGNEKSFVVTAIIIDHQLQADSGAVAEQAAQIAKDLGASKVEIVKVQVVHRLLLFV